MVADCPCYPRQVVSDGEELLPFESGRYPFKSEEGLIPHPLGRTVGFCVSGLFLACFWLTDTPPFGAVGVFILCENVKIFMLGIQYAPEPSMTADGVSIRMARSIQMDQLST